MLTKISAHFIHFIWHFFLVISELKTLEWWMSRSILDHLLLFLISRLNKACFPLVINFQINYPIGIIDIPFLSF